ncbi:hypothetical protein QWJ07_10830 [Frankia sp. RB7]|nr:hypothetical protein [Frankia sp. RB7]
MMRLSPKLRARFYYSIPVAGAQVGWGRSEAYRAARRGDIPTEDVGRFKLVPRKRWNSERKHFLRGPAIRTRRSGREAASAEA